MLFSALNHCCSLFQTCEQYWTLETCGESYGPFIVETTAEIKSDPSVTVRDFTITNTLNVSVRLFYDL